MFIFHIYLQNDKLIEFKSLQYSLFSTSFIEVLGGIFFLFTSAYIIRDKLKVEQAIAGKLNQMNIFKKI